MKRRDLIKTIAAAAKTAKHEWAEQREGGKHTVYTLDGLRVPIPRHNEINEITATAILKQCEAILGEGWWK